MRTPRTIRFIGPVVLCVVALCVAALSGCRNNAPQKPDEPHFGDGVRMQDVTFYSAALGRTMPYRVFLPANLTPGKKLPVVYLLHGGNGSFRDFSNNSNVNKFALDGSGMILVMPEGEFSYWFNAVGKPQDRFQDYVTNDLIADVESRFPAARDRNHRAVVGISMGGWAAVKLALDHPGLYGFACGISPAIEATHRGFSPFAIGQWLRLKEIFGPVGGPVRVANDPFELVKTADPAKTPFLYLTSGANEPLLVPIRRFVGLLEQRHFAYAFAIKPGGHDWGDWDSQLPGCFAAMEEHLGS
jgi:putative tributyrin esterase